jgi:hypothetical protein
MADGMRLLERARRAVERGLSVTRHRVLWQRRHSLDDGVNINPAGRWRRTRELNFDKLKREGKISGIYRILKKAPWLGQEHHDRQAIEALEAIVAANAGRPELLKIISYLDKNEGRVPTAYYIAVLGGINDRSVVPLLMRKLKYDNFAPRVMEALRGKIELGDVPVLMQYLVEKIEHLSPDKCFALLKSISYAFEGVPLKCESLCDIENLQRIVEEHEETIEGKLLKNLFSYKLVVGQDGAELFPNRQVAEDLFRKLKERINEEMQRRT